MMRIAITGTPGTGKTEIGEIISKKLKIDFLDMKPIIKKLVVGFDKERGVEIIDEKRLAEEFIPTPGKSFVVASHLSHFLSPKDIDVCIVLTCTPRELRERLEKRGWSKRKISENVLAESVRICYGEAMDRGHRIIMLDTTGKTAQESAEEAIKML
jgi:adenylate kinase